MRVTAPLAALLLSACAPPGAPVDGDAARIPAAAEGRWGLVPADCTSTRGDAKGLVVVGPTTIGFYESRAVLRTVEERSPTRIAGSFDFTGEGMDWTRRMAIEVRGGGRTLVHRDLDDGATFTYAACP
jgi:hypothetical protein